MGKYNSSIHRVRPLMEEAEKDFSIITQLLALVNVNDKLFIPTKNFYYDSESRCEKALKPSKLHLRKLIQWKAKSDSFKDMLTENKKRRLLYSGNPDVLQEALDKLEAEYALLQPSSKAWYLFEGFTYPDIFIEGDDYIIICEGKWTERSITTHTTHLPYRNQMVRHIQGALNYSNKSVYAFYIVDNACGYCSDLEPVMFKSQLSNESIPLDTAEKEQILKAFCGYTTWQAIEAKMKVPFKSKKDIDNDLNVLNNF